MVLKELVRPPFSNYDIVVYFGAGLFSTFFIKRYVMEPLKWPLPSFVTVPQGDVVGEIFRFLMIAVTVYIIGHLVAFFASQLIEKTVDRFLGKVSSAIQISAASAPANRNNAIRSLIHDRLAKIRTDGAVLTSTVRAIFHLPLTFHYYVIYKLGIFGYYDTRIPRHVFTRIRRKYNRHLMVGQRVSIHEPWYKPIEYFVINRCENSTARMYNYLVISGLFRSLSFVFLCSTWMLLYFSLHLLVHHHWLIKDNFAGGGLGTGILEFLTLSSLAVFCGISYLKFQRRYAEEALMAFLFSKNADLP